MRVKVSSIFTLPDAGSLKAFCDVTFDDMLCVKGLRVLEGKKGLFVTMPREQGKDAKWYDQVKCIDSNLYEQIVHEVLRAYSNITGISVEVDKTWSNMGLE